MIKRLFILGVIFLIGAGIVILSLFSPRLNSFEQLTNDVQKVQFLDKNQIPLNATYANYWNVQDVLPLYEIPEILQKMFVLAEDKNFYHHSGVDWNARFVAVFQNIKSFGVVRGASSISEQVVRMITPRKRTILAKIIEGFEANRLEQDFSKNDILEFYLNQIPYASNRRGIKQASLFYFSKTPDRLTLKEMTALVVMVRSPSFLDLYQNPNRINNRLNRQLEYFYKQGLISKQEYENAKTEQLNPERQKDKNLSVRSFLEYVKSISFGQGKAVQTTLDSMLQAKVSSLAKQRLHQLKHRNVSDVGVLVLERKTGNVLTWVSESINNQTNQINAVLALRQPASAQKPLLYALALNKGWTAATFINDENFSRKVGTGVHHFKNYSERHYGNVTVRQALGNSLNIPALKTIEFVGFQNYFNFLQEIGFNHFDKTADFYREGLALGNAEVSLLELTTAYLMLANNGVLKPVRSFEGQVLKPEKRVLPETISSLIGNILSDPYARNMEFGNESILNFTTQTAVKTGTSTDYRDAWAMGYNHNFVVGIWLGNLTYAPMKDVTGAVGPALLLRSVFAELEKQKPSKPLSLSKKLTKKIIDNKSEYFDESIPEIKVLKSLEPFISSPINGTILAIDPRVPAEFQQYLFEITNLPENAKVIWYLNNKEIMQTKEPSFLWRIQKGSYNMQAKILLQNGQEIDLSHHNFRVK